MPVQAGDTEPLDPIDLPCQCSDADPRGEMSQLVTYTCFYQRQYNNCNQPYMWVGREGVGRQAAAWRGVSSLLGTCCLHLNALPAHTLALSTLLHLPTEQV